MEQITTRQDGYVRDLTEEQAWDLFERAAKFYLGITGEEFIDRWDSGYYSEYPDDPNVIDVASLLPLVR